VYLDPPYDGTFASYSKGGFKMDSHLLMKDLLETLTKRQVHVMISNSATTAVLELYQDYHIEKVSTKRCINSKGDKRKVEVLEVIIRNYDRVQIT